MVVIAGGGDVVDDRPPGGMTGRRLLPARACTKKAGQGRIGLGRCPAWGYPGAQLRSHWTPAMQPWLGAPGFGEEFAAEGVLRRPCSRRRRPTLPYSKHCFAGHAAVHRRKEKRPAASDLGKTHFWLIARILQNHAEGYRFAGGKNRRVLVYVPDGPTFEISPWRPRRRPASVSGCQAGARIVAKSGVCGKVNVETTADSIGWSVFPRHTS